MLFIYYRSNASVHLKQVMAFFFRPASIFSAAIMPHVIHAATTENSTTGHFNAFPSIKPTKNPHFTLANSVHTTSAVIQVTPPT
ncbi:hypothetical protein JD969_19705 [Planctomycetota bacterium]|nr:hypothetical protein JD969_19705 [Planctomycetota bacterium]